MMPSDGFFMSRRQFLKTAAATCTGMVMTGKTKAMAKPESMRIGYLPITDATPLLVAHRLGFFSEQGVSVEKPVMVRSWEILIESFLAGKFNLTHMLFPIPVWLRYKQKIPVKVLAWNHINGSAVTVRGEDGISGFKDLGGRQMAVPSWYSMHNLILQMGIRAYGLTPVIQPQSARLAPDRVNLFILPPPEMPTALLSGKIDGYIVADPFNALAEIRFKARIMRFSGDIWKNHPCCVIVAHEPFIRHQPELIQKATTAIVMAQDWCNRNPEQTAHLLSRDGDGYLPFPREVVKRVFEPPTRNQLVHPDWNTPRIGFQPFPFPSATEFIIEQMKKTLVEGDNGFLATLNTRQAAAELVDDRFVRNALEAVGGINTFIGGDMSRPYEREEILDIR